jgi:RHS repeat-associated protein
VEATPLPQDTVPPNNFNREEPMKFTGHERDFTVGTSFQNSNYIDYMHARSTVPQWGRFLSVDPVIIVKANMKTPQGWNRYAYVQNNPVTLIDPTGLDVALPEACASNITCKEIRDLRNGLSPALRMFVRATKLKDGRVVLNKNALNFASSMTNSSNFAALRRIANNSETVRVSTSDTQVLRSDDMPGHEGGLVADVYEKNGIEPFMGITLTPTASGLALTLVSVNPYLDPRSAATILAHELYGHTDRYLRGLPFLHPAVGRQVFDDIEREAAQNYDLRP